jgi:hypothetical protein
MAQRVGEWSARFFEALDWFVTEAKGLFDVE